MINWKNVAERALWTFLEAFLVALPATISVDTFTSAAWTSVLLSAACAGLSAVKTLAIELIQAKNHPPEEM